MKRGKSIRGKVVLFVGSKAGKKIGSASNEIGNTFVGFRAGENIPNGNRNTLIGSGVVEDSTAGMESNTIIGFNAGTLQGVTGDLGSNNIFLGSEAGIKSASENNIFIGNESGHNRTSKGNIFIGHNAGSTSTPATGEGNIFLGHNAGAKQLRR